MSKKNVILIVDDIPSNVQILANILKDEYAIKVATDGKRAVELAQQEPQPDLILLDVVMPDMDGYDVCSALNDMGNTKDIPIIFVTANDSVEDEERGLNLCAVDYITKPVNSAIVKARVKTHITIKRQYDELKFMALHDKLTGLYNRHYLMDEADRKISSALRKNEPLTIMMADIDHFKCINDNHGHLVGDKVLIAVAAALDKNKRAVDFVSRYGGEEFVTIFDNCNIEDAKLKAEKIRVAIESLNPENLTVTSSFGLVQLNSNHHNFDSLLKDADEALYEAKNSGRNRVVVYEN
ncbi:MAG: diguanylate cyclase [Helicobacteraceae bacterium]|nr:diguanylate cyclase [Helicobacteraceae bacterium]